MTEELLKYFNGDILAAQTWLNKYALKDKNDNILEKTPDEMFRRMAKEFARIQTSYVLNERQLDKKDSNYLKDILEKLSDIGEDSLLLNDEKIPDEKVQAYFEEKYYNLFNNFRYIIPGGSVMSMLGNNDSIGSLSNCFVIGQPEDSYSGISLLREEQVQLMKRRGGVGKDLSTLRPIGSFVNNAAKTSTGATSFMEVDSAITNEVAQDGRRK